MRRGAGGVIAAIVGLAGVFVRGQQTPPSSGQTFRTNTDVVIVDVSVKRGNTPVLGLTAADFQLKDNEVVQRIESIGSAAVPIDLTVVLDVSGVPESRMRRTLQPEQANNELNAEVSRLAATLRPIDRVRVIAADTYVQEVVPLSPATSIPVATRMASGGGSSIFDAILAALLQPVDPARRHVIIASVKVFDTMSAVEAETVRDVAARSDAQLHVVLMQTASAQAAAQENFQCAQIGVCTPVARFWAPHTRTLIPPLESTDADGTVRVPQLSADGRALQAGAVASGGALHQGELLSAPTLASTLAKAFEDFRSSYVLRFTPQGVKREGWHNLTVVVPGARGATVHARNGYAIDAAPTAANSSAPTPPVGKPGATPVALRTPAEFAVAYDRGDRESIRLGLQRTADPVRLLQDIAAAGNPWPGSAQREADYALELADAALSASGMAGTIAASEVGRLLGRFSRLVRNPVEPDAFERAWLWASICLAEGKFSKVAAAPLVDYALVRFPNDPHFVLARAIVVDQRWRIHGTVGIGGSSEGPEQVTQAYVADVVAKYRAAAAFTETSTEASVRLGWFLHRIGRHADAIATLEAAPAAQDPAMNYLRHIFLGHAFVAVDRLDDAIAAYRLAVADVPDAQSARVALMSALAARGDITGAEALGRQIEMAVSAGDPWFNYWFGDARWYAQARDAVRAFSSSKAGGK